VVRRSYEDRLKQNTVEHCISELFTAVKHLFEQYLPEVKTDSWVLLTEGWE